LAFQKFLEVAKITPNLRNIFIIIIIIPQILLGDEMEEEEEKCMQSFGGERQRDYIEDLNGRIILKCILQQ